MVIDRVGVWVRVVRGADEEREWWREIKEETEEMIT